MADGCRICLVGVLRLRFAHDFGTHFRFARAHVAASGVPSGAATAYHSERRNQLLFRRVRRSVRCQDDQVVVKAVETHAWKETH